MSRARLVPVLAGVAVVVVAVLLLTGGGDQYKVKAELANAAGLRPNASVKIAGVPGGKVEKVEITDRDTAVATLVFKDEAAPIGEGTTIQIRPTDLLGERYADLDPGDVSKPLPSGSTIPVKQTASPVELDDVLNMLDVDTRTRLRILINEFGVALGGRGKDFHQLLEELPPALDKTQGLLNEVSAENVRLKELITQGDRITATINGRRDKLGELVTNASRMLGSIADRRRDLGATVANAPGALTQLRSTLTRLESASASLRPAARDLRRTAPPLASTLRALPAFADSAKDTLDKAVSVAPALRRLGVRATPTVRRVEPTAGLLKDLAGGAQPALKHLDRRGMEDILTFVQVWARAMKGRDSLGHFIGAFAIGNEQLLQAAINAYAYGQEGNPAGNLAKREQQRRSQRPALSLPKLTDKPKLKLPRLPKIDTSKLTDTVRKLPEALDRKLQDLLKQQANPTPQSQPSSGSDALRLLDYLFAP